MLLHVRQVLTADDLQHARKLLAEAPWGDGRVTAGEQSALAKNNEQLPEVCVEADALRSLILRGLQHNAIFFSASLPKQISPPMFNRYGGGSNSFGKHVDSAVRYLRDGKTRVRTDISCTLFLSEPDDYDGGELRVEGEFGLHGVKLAAGDMVLYPGNTVHSVTPVTRGHRIASFFWIESMVRSSEQRRLLFDMDQYLMRLRSSVGETDADVVGLTGTYHNLLRMWADT